VLRSWSRRLAMAATAAICTTGLGLTMPGAAAAAPEIGSDSATLVHITSGAFDGAMLCAAPNGDRVWISRILYNPYCQWEKIGNDDKFSLFNPAKGKVLSAPGGEGGVMVMQEPAFPVSDGQSFSWGGWEEWGARALQWYADSGQNVDAGIDGPTTKPVRTRGWRHGHQRELTWNACPVTGTSAQVARSASAVHVTNGLWSDQMSCAADDGTVRLSTDRETPPVNGCHSDRRTGRSPLTTPCTAHS
jgi:hypothetical protein